MIMCDNQNIFEWDFFGVGNQQILFKLQVLLCIFCGGLLGNPLNLCCFWFLSVRPIDKFTTLFSSTIFAFL